MVDVNACHKPDIPPSRQMMPGPPETVIATGKELPPRILLVAQPGEACTLYEAALFGIGARVDTVASIDTFYGAVTHFAYNGIVIDISTKIKALSDHKDLVYSITGRFPVIQVNVDCIDAVGEIANMIAGNAKTDFPGGAHAISVPQVVIGRANVPYPAATPVISIPCETDQGPLYIDLILKTTP